MKVCVIVRRDKRQTECFAKIDASFFIDNYSAKGANHQSPTVPRIDKKILNLIVKARLKI